MHMSIYIYIYRERERADGAGGRTAELAKSWRIFAATLS